MSQFKIMGPRVQRLSDEAISALAEVLLDLAEKPMSTKASITAAPRGINRRTEFVVTESLRLRMASGIRQGEPDQCWPWIGCLREGYGAIKQHGKALQTHVVAFVLANGSVPSGKIVTHDCDNRICCNPSHLKAGTPKTNAEEMFARGGQSRHVKGRECPQSILTESDVRLIHAMRIFLGWTYSRIVSATGFISTKHVLNGRDWKHVPIPTLEESELIVGEWKKRKTEETS